MSYALNIRRCHECRELRCGRRCTCAANERRIDFNAGDGTCPLGYFPGQPNAAQANVEPATPLAWPLLGPALWADLHRAALAGLLTLPWLDSFAHRIPCGDCKQHWLAWTAEHPPDLSSAEGAWAWTWRGHQAVNRRLGRTGMTLEEARKRWG